jgi:hypothetical protein
MAVKMMFQDCLQCILEVFVQATSVLRDGIAHLTLETFDTGGGALGGAFWSQAKFTYRTHVSLHWVVGVGKENNLLAKKMQQSVTFLLLLLFAGVDDQSSP